MKEIKKKNWYVFYTSPRAEKKVNEYLLSLGYESFLPLKSEFKIWRNRQRKLIKSPLFPSYIFVLYLQLIIPQYFISNKSGIWSLSLIVHSKG